MVIFEKKKFILYKWPPKNGHFREKKFVLYKVPPPKNGNFREDENLIWIYTDISTDHWQYMVKFNLNLSWIYTDISNDHWLKCQG